MEPSLNKGVIFINVFFKLKIIIIIIILKWDSLELRLFLLWERCRLLKIICFEACKHFSWFFLTATYLSLEASLQWLTWARVKHKFTIDLLMLLLRPMLLPFVQQLLMLLLLLAMATAIYAACRDWRRRQCLQRKAEKGRHGGYY